MLSCVITPSGIAMRLTGSNLALCGVAYFFFQSLAGVLVQVHGHGQRLSSNTESAFNLDTVGLIPVAVLMVALPSQLT